MAPFSYSLQTTDMVSRHKITNVRMSDVKKKNEVIVTAALADGFQPNGI